MPNDTARTQDPPSPQEGESGQDSRTPTEKPSETSGDGSDSALKRLRQQERRNVGNTKPNSRRRP